MDIRLDRANRQMKANILPIGMPEAQLLDIFLADTLANASAVTGIPLVFVNMTVRQHLTDGSVEHCLFEGEAHHCPLDKYLAKTVEDYAADAHCSLSEALVRIQARFAEDGPATTLSRMLG